jgi:hypothetical protein
MCEPHELLLYASANCAACAVYRCAPSLAPIV